MVIRSQGSGLNIIGKLPQDYTPGVQWPLFNFTSTDVLEVDREIRLNGNLIADFSNATILLAHAGDIFILFNEFVHLDFGGRVVINRENYFACHLRDSYRLVASWHLQLSIGNITAFPLALESDTRPNNETQITFEILPRLRSIYFRILSGTPSQCGIPPVVDWIYCEDAELVVGSVWNITESIVFSTPIQARGDVYIGSRLQVVSLSFAIYDEAFFVVSNLTNPGNAINFNSYSQGIVFDVWFSSNQINTTSGGGPTYFFNWDRPLVTGTDFVAFNTSYWVEQGSLSLTATNVGPPICLRNETRVSPNATGLTVTCLDAVSSPGSTAAGPSSAIVSPPSNVGGIVAAVVVVLIVAIAAVVIGVLLWRRHQNGKSSSESKSPRTDSPLLSTSEVAMSPITKRKPNANARVSLDEPQTSHKPRAFSSTLKLINLSALTVMQELGKGSFGSVSLAILNGEFVAVKKVTEGADEKRLIAFEKEAALFASIKQHRNLVRFIGACSDTQGHAIVMVRVHSNQS